MSAAAPIVSGAAGVAGRVRRRLARPPGRWLKPVTFAALLAPFAYLVYALLTGGLGPDPIEALTHETGQLGLRFLLLSLALTPLRLWLKATWPCAAAPHDRAVRLLLRGPARRHLGRCWTRSWTWRLMLADVLRRPYVLAGTVAFAIMVPLALTSPKAAARRLGGARWGALHRWVYLAAAAAIVHWVWLAKGDIAEPWVYFAVLVALLGVRFVKLLGSSKGGSKGPGPVSG